ncbi:MAG: hypothetical protein Q8J78_13125 [Moraxellaceae bacterium]|nr:hypothetical protein [Moraxellaceae bacterium]
MSIDPMSDGLLRQRRNLISISCVLIFVKFSGVKIDNLSFLSINFGALENPAAIYIAIWIAFFYFLFRYYQYFIQDGLRNLIRHHYECQEARVFKHVARLARDINAGAHYHPSQLVSLKNENWKVRVTYAGEQNQKTGEIENEVRHFIVPKSEIYKIMFISICDVSFNTSAITDYILPFIIATFALAYCFCGADSSLLQALRNGFA